MPQVHGVFVADSPPTSHAEGRPDLPLVLIHGAGGSHLDWPDVVRHLPDRRVLALDLPGHGKASSPGHTTIPAYAASVIAALDMLQVQRVYLAGHSMGGGVALTVALEHSERVAGLILIGTGARLRVNPTLLAGLASAKSDENDRARRQIAEYSGSASAPDEVRATTVTRLAEVDPDVLRGDFEACQRFDVMAEVNRIRVPTLIIVGAEDRMTPPKFSEYLAAQIEGAALTILPGGHTVALEQPAALGACVTAWLVQQSQRSHDAA